MVVTIVCNGGMCRIVDRLPSVPIRNLHGECAYQIGGFEHIQRSWDEKQRQKYKNWDGMIRLFHKSRRTFAIGLLPLVCRILDEHKVHYLVTYSPSNDVKIDLPPIPAEFEPRPYQVEATEAGIAQKVGVIRVATGGGKTAIASYIMSRLKMPSVFLVHTKDLLYQARDMFTDMFGHDKVGIIGDGHVDIKEVTVATIQTMSRIYDFEYEHDEFDEIDKWNDEETDLGQGRSQYVQSAMNEVGVVFMDECHRVAAPTAMMVMEKLTNPRYRFGLSASPWRDDGSDLAIQACLGEVVYTATASDLIDLGFLVPPIIRVFDVPARSFPRRVPYATIYKEYIVENEERNDRIVRAAISMVRRRRPCLVLVQHIRHGEHLQRLISEALGIWVPFISGRDNVFKRKEALDDIRKGKSGILIASVIADEGLDLKPLSGLILAGGGKSSVKALQRIGRTLRPFDGKNDAEIIDFNDQAKYLIHHSEARMRLYETEPRWTIIDA